jgi:hypothetical protein
VEGSRGSRVERRRMRGERGTNRRRVGERRERR